MAEGSGARWEETRRAWDAVAERFSEVGRRVGDQYRKLGEQPPTNADTTASGVSEAVRDAVDELDRAFTSVGDTLRDPQAKETLRQAVGSFGKALEATFAEVGEELRRQFGSK
jgi:DNA-binding ferritin-like protein